MQYCDNEACVKCKPCPDHPDVVPEVQPLTIPPPSQARIVELPSTTAATAPPVPAAPTAEKPPPKPGGNTENEAKSSSPTSPPEAKTQRLTYKSLLHNYLYRQGLSKALTWGAASRKNRMWYVSCSLADKKGDKRVEGAGQTKNDAEHDCARLLLKELGAPVTALPLSGRAADAEKQHSPTTVEQTESKGDPKELEKTQEKPQEKPSNQRKSPQGRQDNKSIEKDKEQEDKAKKRQSPRQRKSQDKTEEQAKPQDREPDKQPDALRPPAPIAKALSPKPPSPHEQQTPSPAAQEKRAPVERRAPRRQQQQLQLLQQQQQQHQQQQQQYLQFLAQQRLQQQLHMQRPPPLLTTPMFFPFGAPNWGYVAPPPPFFGGSSRGRGGARHIDARLPRQPGPPAPLPPLPRASLPRASLPRGSLGARGGPSRRGGARTWRKEDLPPPHPDMAGHWVEREMFEKKQSFGFFECSCGKSWYSAHAFKEYRQGCQTCSEEGLPRFLWANEEDERRKVEQLDSPHDYTRCEAGRLGLCPGCERKLPRR